MPIPNADALISAYPLGPSDEVKKRIGGGINAGWITNTCAIRLSRSFNYSGQPIPSSYGNSKGKPALAIYGGDKKLYGLRVAEFRKWLEQKYGKPTLSFKAGPYGTAPSQLHGKKGIICFVDCGWSDASGHLDLWDGEKVVNHGYFELAKQVYLWESRPQVAAEKTGTITQLTNVRAGPSTSAAIVGQLAAGTVVRIMTKSGSFTQINPGEWAYSPNIQVNP
jgi:hypothetical protein